MTAALPAFPGSRVLAGWWRQLAFLRPRLLWVAHLDFHRLEALVRTRQRRPLGRVDSLVLRALAHNVAFTLEGLDQKFGLGRQLLARVLRELEVNGLIRQDAAGRWSAAGGASEALAAGDFALVGQERRSFCFLDDEAPPRFIDLHGGLSKPRAADAAPSVGGALAECLARPAEWKRRHHFPIDVAELVVEAAEWEQVIVVHPESLLTAIVVTSGDSRLVGFAVRPEDWKLHVAEVAFTLEADWQETFPCLSEPSAEEWLRSWLNWCRPRNLARGEAETCRLERHDWRLRVSAGPALIQRLRAARSESLKGDAWVLAGQGPQRLAAQIEIVESAG
jgi:hypothetical protein